MTDAQFVFINLPPNRKIVRTADEDRFGDMLWKKKMAPGKYPPDRLRMIESRGIDLAHLADRDRVFLTGPPTWYLHLSPILTSLGKTHLLIDFVKEPSAIRDIDAPICLRFLVPEAEFYLLSPITNTTAYAYHVIECLKRERPQSKIVVGGPQATYRPHDFLIRGADLVIRGEGEHALSEVAKGTGPDRIAGASFLRDGDVIHIPMSSERVELDSIPSFDWSTLPPAYVPSFYVRYFSQRGCPMSCCFCADVLWAGRRVRRKSASTVSREVTHIIRQMVFLEMHLADNCFTASRKHASDVASVLGRHGIPWSAETRVDMVDNSLMEELASAGCVEFEFGCESAVDEVLRCSNKGITRRRMLQAFEDTKAAGIRVHTNWMVGMPGDNVQYASDTVEFACRCMRDGLIDTLDYFILVPYPGSPVAERPVDFGQTIAHERWEEYLEDSVPVISYDQFSSGSIHAAYQAGVRKLADAMEDTLGV